jgi:hypothetical protein
MHEHGGCVQVSTCALGQDSSSRFVGLLRSGDESGDFSEFVTLLRRMSPTTIDQELRALEVRHLCLSQLYFHTAAKCMPVSRGHICCVTHKQQMQQAIVMRWRIHHS